MTNSIFDTSKINQLLCDLFPINRSLTGDGNRKTLNYIKSNYLPYCDIKEITSGTPVFDWKVPPEWNVKDAYVKNRYGKKIIDFNICNLHVMSYSEPFSGIVEEDELIKKIHTIPDKPDWIPYRTSYYSKNWGFCCKHSLLASDDFKGPFEVKIDSELNESGSLVWLEALKPGLLEDEILISSYCCHPSLANDNLSGFVAATLLFEYLQSIETKYSYRLVILPETIGAITFLSQANTANIIGGMIMTCVGGPDNFSLKEGFDRSHWINEAAHFALNSYTGGDYRTYKFVPDGSDERQYSTPGFRIVTPSIHKSKYYEYDEYHTSADNLEFISADNIRESLEIHRLWSEFIESYCFPIRIMRACEYQLGKRGLYPAVGGTLNQPIHVENKEGYYARNFNFDSKISVNGKHLEAFHWLMHLADGQNSNFDISSKSGIDIVTINEAISLFKNSKLIEIQS